MTIGSRNRAGWHHFEAKSLIWQQIFEVKSQIYLKSRRKFADTHFNDVEHDSFFKCIMQESITSTRRNAFLRFYIL